MKFSKYDKILFFATLITMVLFSLLSDTVVFGVRFIVIISLALICFLLFYVITNKDRKIIHAKIQNINQVILMNPN